MSEFSPPTPDADRLSDLERKLRFERARRRTVELELAGRTSGPVWRLAQGLANSAWLCWLGRRLKSVAPVALREWVKRRLRGDARPRAAAGTPFDAAALDRLRLFLDEVDAGSASSLVVLVDAPAGERSGRPIGEVAQALVDQRPELRVLALGGAACVEPEGGRGPQRWLSVSAGLLERRSRPDLIDWPARADLWRACVILHPHSDLADCVNEFQLAGWKTAYVAGATPPGGAATRDPASFEAYLAANCNACLAAGRQAADRLAAEVPELPIIELPADWDSPARLPTSVGVILSAARAGGWNRTLPDALRACECGS